jgi:hypothetical protein
MAQRATTHQGIPENEHNQTMSPDCHLSLVVTTRNDNHGGDMLRRFQMFAETLLEQANRHSLSGELIVVEWNPPPGPRLHEVLKLRVKSDCFSIRFIEVPPEVHQAIRNADMIPLFQMIGKNVGIRRARGEFVLATNPDLLFSDNVIAFMASDKLSPDVMYRIDRHDVPAEIPDNVSIDRKLAWCAANVLRIHRRLGSFSPPRRLLLRFWARVRNPASWKKLKRRVSSSLSPFWYRLMSLRWENLKYQASATLSLWYRFCYLRLVKLKLGASAMGSLWLHLWYLRLDKTKKLLSQLPTLFYDPRRFVWVVRQGGRALFTKLLVQLPAKLFGLIRSSLWRLTYPLRRFASLIWRPIKRLMDRFHPLLLLYSPRRLIRRLLWGALRLTDPLPKVHTNGCGDFTLISRAQWFELRGYPELPLWSMHIDSLLCYMAVASRVREYTLRPPAKIYHMEHYNSWVVMNPDEKLRTFTKKPWIDYGLLSDLWENMYRTSRPIRFNAEDWGLADWSLNEVIILSGEKQFIKQSPAFTTNGELTWDPMDHHPARLSLSSV